MPIQMQCPQCQAKAALPDGHAGRPVRCKVCKATFTIPTDAGANPDQPTVIDRYLVRELLGEGAFGSVYRAFDPRLERDVALKVLRPHMMSSAQAVERFLREAKSAAKLLHPNIVPVYDAGRSGSIYYITSAFIKGMTLASAIPEEGGIEPLRAVRLTAQLATALGYAHQQGILHRDVKPANAMLNEQESLHLMDFGLAGWTQEESTRLTRLGAVMGTPAYMAPEQASGDTKNVGPAADLYSAGVVLYELLTSRLPFEGGHPAAFAYLVVHTAPAPPSQHKPDLDAGLEAICLKAMAKKPEDRFASGEEMAAALTNWTQTAMPLAAPTPVARLAKPTAPSVVRSKATVDPLTSAPNKQTIVPSSGRPAARRPSVFDRETVMPASAKHSTLGSPPAAQTPTDSPRPRVKTRLDILIGAGIGLAFVAVLLLVMWHKPILDLFQMRGEPAIGAKTPPAGTLDESQQGSQTQGDKDQQTLEKKTPEDEITNGIGMKLRLIKAGKFLMGSPTDEKDRVDAEGPQHMVELTRSFYLGEYPVTVGQFTEFAQEAQYKTEAETDGFGGWGYNSNTGKSEQAPMYTWRNPGFAQTYAHPVVNVSWNDSMKFCEWLSRKEGKTYGLPTEAQWEYACRAGTTGAYFFGDVQKLGDYAWNRDNSGGSTHVVGTKNPNLWGLYDMHGNVFQWCADYYDALHYRNSSNKDPQNTLKTDNRVVRGGCWEQGKEMCRDAYRGWIGPGDRRESLGLRVVMRPDEPLIAADQTPVPAVDLSKSDPMVVQPVSPSVTAADVAPQPMPPLQEKKTDEITNGVGMRLKLIAAGKFFMGSPVGRFTERPRHEVELTQPFYLGVFPVTRGQFAAFVKETGYKTEAETDGRGGWGFNKASRKMEQAFHYTWQNPSFAQTDDDPVVNVSWNDAVKYCAWLSRKEGKTYGLPTEAQWEYACRANTTTAYSFGDDPRVLADYAWYRDNSRIRTYTHPVGAKNPNPWGLFDMHGNVRQWCGDYYDEKYYNTSPRQDPLNSSETNARVCRGSSWFSYPDLCRSAYRHWTAPDDCCCDLGLRVVMRPSEPLIAANSTPTQSTDSVSPTATTEAAASQTKSPMEEKKEDENTNSIGMRLKLIKPGKFLMGSANDEKGHNVNEGPQHEVELTRPFYLGVYPVTLGQFKMFVKEAEYITEAERANEKAIWREPGFLQSVNDPVVCVSWNDAVKFCEWLSRKEKKTYSLPTEAQWEYAYRAGTTTTYPFGDDLRMRPVGGKKPNKWGLFDMSGNVAEWCADYYDKKYYNDSPRKDPENNVGTNARVLRGDNAVAVVAKYRAAARDGNAPNSRRTNYGFRVCLRPD